MRVKRAGNLGERLCESGDGALLIVARLVLGRRDVPNRFEQPSMIEPVHPRERRALDRVERAPRPFAANDLGLEEPDDGFGEGVVIGVPTAADRRRDADVGQSLGVTASTDTWMPR